LRFEPSTKIENTKNVSVKKNICPSILGEQLVQPTVQPALPTQESPKRTHPQPALQLASAANGATSCSDTKDIYIDIDVREKWAESSTRLASKITCTEL
jgi:hypothetical protein